MTNQYAFELSGQENLKREASYCTPLISVRTQTFEKAGLTIESYDASYCKSQTHSVNDSIYDFDRVLLEIPMKYCIVHSNNSVLLAETVKLLYFKTLT